MRFRNVHAHGALTPTNYDRIEADKKAAGRLWQEARVIGTCSRLGGERSRSVGTSANSHDILSIPGTSQQVR